MGGSWTDYFRLTLDDVGNISKYLKSREIEHKFDEKALDYFSNCVREMITFTMGLEEEPIELAIAYKDSEYPYRFRVGLAGYNLSLEDNDRRLMGSGIGKTIDDLREGFLKSYRECGGDKSEFYDGIADLDIIEKHLPEGMRARQVLSRAFRFTKTFRGIGHTPREDEVAVQGPNSTVSMIAFSRDSSSDVYNLVYVRSSDYVLNKPGKKEKT